MNPSRISIPLSERKQDIPILIFLWINILFITYQIDTEQLVIKDPSDFEYPIWPRPFIIDMVHWWGANFDPLLMARPPFWQMTIWIDQLFFGPFYIAAIYAFTKGRDWIRNWTFLYAASIMTNVTIILGEEVMGEHASDSVAIVFLANGPWFLVPLFMILRVWKPHPFTKPAESGAD